VRSERRRAIVGGEKNESGDEKRKRRAVFNRSALRLASSSSFELLPSAF
jgi:hypothetical protein